MNANGQILNMDGTVWDQESDPDGTSIKWVANEGIHISRIMRHLSTLPTELNAKGLPGAELVREILRISEKANANGTFAFKPKDACLTCEVRAANPVSDENADLQTAQPTAGHLPANTLVLPLQLKINVSVTEGN